MGFFDFLKNKPNEKKAEQETASPNQDAALKDSEFEQGQTDIQNMFDSQMLEGDKIIQDGFRQIDELIAEGKRLLAEQEKEGR